MKRYLVLLLAALLLLSGCKEEAPETTPAVTTVPPATAPDPGTYLPESALEKQTDGAVRAYGVTGEYGNDLFALGEDLLLLSHYDSQTVLTRLTGENCVESYRTTAEGMSVYSVRVYGTEIGYFNEADGSVVYLDGLLQEIGRVQLPVESKAGAALSGDLKTVYYCTDTEIRAYDGQSSISRLVRQQKYESQYPEQVLFGDSVLQCRVTDQNGMTFTDFISTETGESIGRDTVLLQLDAWQNAYFLQRMDGVVSELLVGKKDAPMQAFYPGDNDGIFPVLSMGCAVALRQEDSGLSLELYDLTTGLRKAEVMLPGCVGAGSFVADGQYLWFLSWNEEQKGNTLLRWDTRLTPVADETVYLGKRYTRKDPDTEGLADCKEQAAALSEKYGLQLLIDTELPQPEDYSFVYEYQVRAIADALDRMDAVLAQFPEGFFSALESGSLRVGFVRSIAGLTEDAVPDVRGLQYWMDGEGCIALTFGEELERTFYHELSHILDAYVYANTVTYDDWESLNPKGFSYDGNYSLYGQRDGKEYLEGEKRAFVDEYSKTFPKEDRARILECALTEGNEAVFASDTMQNKLRKLCQGIREAYDWEKDERTFLWEQYLEQPLAYTGKK